MRNDDGRFFRLDLNVQLPSVQGGSRCGGRSSDGARTRTGRAASKAYQLGEERYLERWLALFKNRSKKDAWLIYTGGSGYPALGTFYRHVRDEGIEKYLRQHFGCDLEKVLHKLRVEDQEITVLLKSAEKLGVRRHAGDEDESLLPE